MYGQMTAGSWISSGRGDCAGDLRDLRCRCATAFRRHARRPFRATGGTRRDGRSTAARGDDVRRGNPRHRSRRITNRQTRRNRILRWETVSWLDEGLAWIREAVTQGKALSVGVVGNAAEVLPELLRRGVVPDVLTDQTSAHDTLNGYVPAGLSLAEAAELRRRDPRWTPCRDRESGEPHASPPLRRPSDVLLDH